MVAPQATSSLPHLSRDGVAAQPAHMPQQSAAALAAAFKNQLSNAVSNNYRLRAVAERLQFYFHGGVKLGQSDLFHLIFALSRGIDYALSINDNPGISNCLPSLIKQVYQHLKDPLLKSAIMVLMISVKNACKNRWFLKPDADELLCMSNELSSSFCMPVNDSIIDNPQDAISKIMVRQSLGGFPAEITYKDQQSPTLLWRRRIELSPVVIAGEITHNDRAQTTEEEEDSPELTVRRFCGGVDALQPDVVACALL
ncbi:E4 SUMO-protein ligase PIAL2-like [Curcuma longa]|uniref:E4 SUMO-protein ligase PIAL2-like n=1 Tax=Curcuma longa TaxID=136217 RepID=UPI003D9F04C0